MSLAVSIAVVLAAYLMGGFMPGYWFVRWRTGRDVREQGSGGTGATNAGRALGRSGFFVVMVLDGLKGAVAVALARWQQQPELWLYAAAVAAIMGHVWPLQLGFRGGKGIATLLGAWLLLAPWALLPCLILAAIVLLILRRFTLAGLCGLSVLPVATWWASGDSRIAAVGGGCSLIIILYAHRDHLRRWCSEGTPAL